MFWLLLIPAIPLAFILVLLLWYAACAALITLRLRCLAWLIWWAQKRLLSTRKRWW